MNNPRIWWYFPTQLPKATFHYSFQITLVFQWKDDYIISKKKGCPYKNCSIKSESIKNTKNANWSKIYLTNKWSITSEFWLYLLCLLFTNYHSQWKSLLWRSWFLMWRLVLCRHFRFPTYFGMGRVSPLKLLWKA